MGQHTKVQHRSQQQQQPAQTKLVIQADRPIGWGDPLRNTRLKREYEIFNYN
jgi:hypothetical protein